MNCSKKRLFAKRFYSKRIVNVDAESDETTEKGCNSITSASESELAFLAIDAIPRPVDSNLPVAASDKKLEVLNADAGKIRFIQITLRCKKKVLQSDGRYRQSRLVCKQTNSGFYNQICSLSTNSRWIRLPNWYGLGRL